MTKNKSTKVLTGINIQWPISQEILSGKKTIETRTYKIPEHYINQEMYLIETPGKSKKFKARIIAVIRFFSCIEYKNEQDFYSDTDRHLVERGSIWAWKDKKKYGWEVELIKQISPPIELNTRKGIVYTKNISLPSMHSN